MNLKNYIIGEIKEKLDEYENRSEYGCDWAYKLFESENVDGSYTCSTFEAIEWIKKYFDDLGEVVEEMTAQLGRENVPNVFTSPEGFQVAIILEVASYLLGQCTTIKKEWNNKFTLTKAKIIKIKKELDELDENYYIY